MTSQEQAVRAKPLVPSHRRRSACPDGWGKARGVRALVMVWCAFLVCRSVPTGAQRVKGTPIVSVLEQYARGEYASVSQTLEGSPAQLERLDSDLRHEADSWISSAPARRRRALVAGALALELTHAMIAQTSRATVHLRLTGALDPQALPHIIRLMADNQAAQHGDVEHAFASASLATWEEWSGLARNVGGDAYVTREPGWAILLGHPALVNLGRVQSAFGHDGYLGDVLARFPNDPRFHLAHAEGVEAIDTRCNHWFCADEVTPRVLADLHQRMSLPSERPEDGGQVWGLHNSAAANLAAFARLPEAAGEFAQLARDYPSVRGEADLHIGYLEIRAARPDAALTPLATAVTSDDSYVQYLAEFFSGRAFEALGQRNDAVAHYRRALTIVPNAPSAATLLVAQLALSESAADRLEANAILLASVKASPRPVDPWDLYWQGDARLWPVYIDQLRAALRQ